MTRGDRQCRRAFRAVAMTVSAYLVGPALWVPVQAQTIQGVLRESESGSPVEGALVLLIDESGEGRDGYLTNYAGRFRLRAPGPGRYTVRAERIGFETVFSEVVELSTGQVSGLQLRTFYSPIPLEELRVEGDRRCVVRPEEGMALASLWDEARKALLIQEWTAREQTYPFQILRYSRRLDPSETKVEAESREHLRTLQAYTAVRSRPASELVERGFVQPVEGAEHSYEYFGPDATVLLSQEFLDSHCLRLAFGDDPSRGVGVSFEPVRHAEVPDIEGTLWMDPESFQLRFLEYDYTWAPLPEALGLAKGRVEFENLPSGAWIVRNWWIRTPILQVDWGGRIGERMDLVGYFEEGEEISRFLTHGEAGPQGPRGSLLGRVWDSARNGPVENARVFLAGTAHSAVSDASGRFLMDDIREGRFSASFTNSALDSLGVDLPGREVSIVAGEVAEVDLAMPPMMSLLAALCRDTEQRDAESALVGIVRDAATEKPVPGASVNLVWVDHTVWGGIRMTLEATADGEGRFRACGVSPGALVTAQAASPNYRGVGKKVRVAAGTIAHVELVLVAR